MCVRCDKHVLTRPQRRSKAAAAASALRGVVPPAHARPTFSSCP
jgi:hypothetical protein